MTSDEEPNSDYPRLEKEIAWYDTKSGDAQWYYKKIKYVEFASGAMIPAAAVLAPPWVTAVLGVFAIMLEGLQQINQWQHNWITYRSTCEALRHEKYSYLAKSGVYDKMTDVNAKKLLVERVESLISTEHAKWISAQEYARTQLSTAPKKKKL